ncbi:MULTISPECIES: MoaD/ThiS family protein [unclassified Salinivibrio]|uniref:MoaD/ThiS family protein n=1 Tax=unclassified Salinivibrio TaxID=2636825 RepID=UPI000847F6B2|nr:MULTISPECIES: MoaD/ThiS family protein [unclassified Salinivibrio]ODP96335.1 hypothetical protein BGL48_04520 [Salinivibrio sp. BNH]ODQ00519.1 hypothetical protein BGK46_06270 [Salinivibrio sp. DV]
MIEIRFFGLLRERIGESVISLEVPTPLPVSELIKHLIEQNTAFLWLNDLDVISAVNHTIVESDFTINKNDEVAFFPPVTGG